MCYICIYLFILDFAFECVCVVFGSSALCYPSLHAYTAKESLTPLKLPRILKVNRHIHNFCCMYYIPPDREVQIPPKTKKKLCSKTTFQTQTKISTYISQKNRWEKCLTKKHFFVWDTHKSYILDVALSMSVLFFFRWTFWQWERQTDRRTKSEREREQKKFPQFIQTTAQTHILIQTNT